MGFIDKTKKAIRLIVSRRYTHNTLTDAQEAFTSTFDINASEIYADQNQSLQALYHLVVVLKKEQLIL